MLTTLRIRNLALVADLTLELQAGFNAITGETGAGKSVILGAIQLVLGQRADRGAIRSGADFCSVEAVFNVGALRPAIDALLVEQGLDPCDADALVLKRSFTASGTNRQFINGSPTNLATLASLGTLLVDLHGPHEHQSLLQTSRQLAILDAFGGLASRRTAFAALHQQHAALVAEKAALVVDEQTYARQLDLLRFQTHEIRAARLQPGEDESLAAEYQRVSNAARILELAQGAANALGDDDDALLTRMGSLGRLLHDLARLDSEAASLSEQHEQAISLLRDLQSDLSRYAGNVELDPERLVQLQERLDLIQTLRRKYGSSVEEIIAFGERAHAELDSLEGRDAELSRIQAELAAVEGRMVTTAAALTADRRRVAPKLAKAVEKELATLGFKQAGFEAAIRPATGHDTPASAGPAGFDQCEFLFAPNPGEPARPLRAIASSGELARVMLALKTVLAAEDEVPVLVFDEVDANVGGETAHAVGDKMRRIAGNHQVLCITHLAPVAAYSAAHYVVTKDVQAGRTESRIFLLDAPGQVAELGRMLGGGPAAERHAAELLSKASAAS
jgi:DNA repair protein RecN (Recombination protein N)